MATEAFRLVASRNRRVVLFVVAAAVIAAAAIVGATLLQTRGDQTTLTPQKGSPPLELAFGVAAGTEVKTLVRAQSLYNHGHVAQAARLFARYDSPAAEIGSAFAAWQDGNGVPRLQQLSTRYPSSALVALHLGWAYYWVGRTSDAATAWEQAARVGRDSPYGVEAEDALHPNDYVGLPYLVLDFKPAPAIRKLPAAQELAALARAAARPDAHAKLLYGAALWGLDRPVSAERQFDAAAQLTPHDPVARAVAAVGAFTKANPVKAFSRLGPLTAVFPKAAVVRFYLGLLLIWTDEPKKAVAQLRLAAADGPHTLYGKSARTLLAHLSGTRSK